VCKWCRAKPKTERRAIEDQDDIFRGRQSCQDCPGSGPAKALQNRRLKFLAQKHPELLRKLEATGLIFAHTWDWESREVFAQSNSEEAEVIVPEDGEGTDLSAQEDWEIPF
jgi:hypothetical protein